MTGSQRSHGNQLLPTVGSRNYWGGGVVPLVKKKIFGRKKINKKTKHGKFKADKAKQNK